MGQQLRVAEERGAKGVQVLGTGDEEKDTTIQKMVERMSNFAQFVPATMGEGGKVDIQKTAATAQSMRAETKGESISGSGASKGVSIARKLQKDLNISPAAAAGIVGNLMLESGLKPDNVEDGKGFEDGPINNIPVGTRRVGYGWGQWTNDRLESFREFLKSRGADNRPATDDDNYAYLIKELKSTEPIRNHWKTGTSIPQDDPAKAATWFMMNWERPGVPHQDRRQQYAKEIFQKIKGGETQRKSTPRTTARPTPRQVLDRRDSGVTDNAQGRSSQPQTPVSPRGGTDNPYGMVVTSDFGKMRGLAISPGKHMGVDIAGPKGVPLQAFTDAEITATSPPDAGYGNWVAWKDVQGIEHFYGHMVSPTPFKAGDKVKKGTKLGEVGSTGNSSGPHLHWEAATVPGDTGRSKSAVLSRINPLSKYSEWAPFGGESKPPAKDTEVSIPKPAAAVAAVTDKATGVSREIARPSGRRGTNITTMDLPGNAGQQMPVALPEKSGQVNNLPFVNTSYSDDVYKIHTRSVFNIVG